MSSEDQNYLSWMASAALAVMMVVVMFWIRSQIPDDASGDVPGLQTAAADTTTEDSKLSSTRDAIASVYECVSGANRTRSDSPCGTGAVLPRIGGPQRQKLGDASVHHR